MRDISLKWPSTVKKLLNTVKTAYNGTLKNQNFSPAGGFRLR